MSTFLKKLGNFFLETIQAIVVALSIFIVVYLFLFQPHQVKGKSMYPNFDDKEFILTNKISYRFTDPKRGDVIVFKAPAIEPCAEIECEYIKRIIALPGDRVMLKNGKFYINGELLDESYLDSSLYSNPGSFLPEGVEKTIPKEYYLPIGDNRPASRDGREFGPVPTQSIVGKAWLRYWPPNKTGFVKHINYSQ